MAKREMIRNEMQMNRNKRSKRIRRINLKGPDSSNEYRLRSLPNEWHHMFEYLDTKLETADQSQIQLFRNRIRV
jgi:hypothetical protein